MTPNTTNPNPADAIATVALGKVTIEYSTPQPNTMKRRRDGSVIYVGYSDFLEGKLVSAQVCRENDNSRGWEFLFEQQDGSTILLTLPYHSPTAQAILFRLPNIDLCAEFGLNFSARATLFTNVEITQNGSDIAPYYTPATLNGMPPAIPFAYIGESVINDCENQLDYMQTVIPALFLTANQIS